MENQNKDQQPQQGQSQQSAQQKPLAPVGGYIFAQEPVVFNESRPAVELKVRNTGDRPIQVGSHFHFFEVNRALEFDREAAYGMRLNIAATTAIRFEPGDEKTVSLIPFGGLRNVHGFNNLVDGWAADMHVRPIKVAEALALGFKSAKH